MPLLPPPPPPTLLARPLTAGPTAALRPRPSSPSSPRPQRVLAAASSSRPIRGTVRTRTRRRRKGSLLQQCLHERREGGQRLRRRWRRRSEGGWTDCVPSRRRAALSSVKGEERASQGQGRGFEWVATVLHARPHLCIAAKSEEEKRPPPPLLVHRRLRLLRCASPPLRLCRLLAASLCRRPPRPWPRCARCGSLWTRLCRQIRCGVRGGRKWPRPQMQMKRRGRSHTRRLGRRVTRFLRRCRQR